MSQYEFGSKRHEVMEDGSGLDYFFKQKDRIRTITLSFNYGF